ncbi:MAG: SDR family NAD(P)-dependent oxidoreductase [Spirochaetaceae bacterium]|nr:MAG: SDR family NAD(P)-dependent oxidoreductase [Spirochaetaceae bacterium]
MKVLVTGAFGNIGEGVVEELLDRRHEVRCFDIPNRRNVKKAARLDGGVEIVWGDLRNPGDLAAAVHGVDIVIHLAFVIPKLSATGIGCEDQPDWAWEVNVGGTGNLLEAIAVQEPPAKIIFASSLHIYGITQHQQPPRQVNDPLKPMEYYARHKVECEELVRRSGLTWSIFRFAAALPFSLKLDPAMFEIRLDNRMEYVHNRDVGLALANAVNSSEIWGKILHIGGGARCQYSYRQIVEKVLDGVGVGMLPEYAFSQRPFSTDWIDTRESQRLLHFQRYTLDDYIREFSDRLGFRRILARIFRPIVRMALLARSPYYRARRFQAQKETMAGKLAVVTCGATSFGAAAAKKLTLEGMRLVLLEKPGENLQELAFQISEEGGRADVVTADVTRGENVIRLYRKIRRTWGPVDVLVNHADLVWYNGRKDAYNSRVWKRIERNLFGVIRFSELIVEDMKKNGEGHVVFLEPVLKLLPIRPTPLLRGLRSFFRVYIQQLNRDLRLSPVRVSLVRAGIATTDLLKISRLLRVFSRRDRSYGIEVRPEVLANRIWLLLVRPEPVIYIPSFLRLFAWMDSYTGWLVEFIRTRLSPVRVKSA